MSARLVLPVLACVVLAVIPAAGSPPAQQAPPGAAQRSSAKQPVSHSEEVRAGIAHFDRAFYEHTPNKRDREAALEFDLSIAAFQRELKTRPSSPAAHRYLARIYSARREFSKAAAHYDRLTEIDPLDVDSCVLAALAYVEDGRIQEARARLVAARLRTSDPAVLARLAEYQSKLDSIR